MQKVYLTMNKLLLLKGDIRLIDDLLHETCAECIFNNGKPYNHMVCPFHNDKRRVSYIASNDFEVYACSENAKTTANFKKEIQAFVEIVPYAKRNLAEMERNSIKKSERRYQQLVHNLKSINAHCIQELYAILPSQYGKNVRDSINYTKERLKSHLSQAAVSVFHLAKYFSMMNVEFLVYERMLNDKVELSPDMYKIRDVVMKTLHMFFDDFTKKMVRVNIAENYDKVLLDYESFATALYYIIENATKYVLPSSDINIEFDKNDNVYSICLYMYSYYLSDEDKKHIFDEGYSGEEAIRTHSNGHGIGMYRAKKLLTQCGANIEFEAGEKIQRMGNNYGYNLIKISIPQHDKN